MTPFCVGMAMNKIVAYAKIATPVAIAMPKEAPLAASPTNLVPRTTRRGWPISPMDREDDRSCLADQCGSYDHQDSGDDQQGAEQGVKRETDRTVGDRASNAAKVAFP